MYNELCLLIIHEVLSYVYFLDWNMGFVMLSNNTNMML